MIIGKPITFGSSGLMAEIIASGDVLSTDTVVASKGLVTINAIWVTDHFVIGGLDIGTWTVTATQGNITKTYTVLIDEIAKYELTIEYVTYLYKLGDERESLTGGWGTGNALSSSTKTGTISKNSTNVSLTCVSMSSPCMYMRTAINLTNYSYLKVAMRGVNGGTYYLDSYYRDSYPTSSRDDRITTTLASYTAVYNISSYTTTKKIAVSNANVNTIYIDKIWLE